MDDAFSAPSSDVGPLLRIALEDGGGSQRQAPPHGWKAPSAEDVQQVLPHYEVECLIARGGMGAVYRGIQRSLRRTVAIKVLPPGLEDGDVQFAQRFKHEAQAMARLSHPNIVSVHDAGETAEGLLYFVMEFIEGTDVAQLIEKEKKLEPVRALTIAAAVSDALAFAHQRGIIHRDIKPSNVMLDRDGRVKVADFGLAKVICPESSLLTGSDVVMGTPDFIAPEAMIRGAQVDARADIYAVGVMLYQMITGHLPRGRFAMPSGEVPGTDPRWDAVLDKALQRDREKRYASAVELRADLDRIGGASDGISGSGQRATRSRGPMFAPRRGWSVVAAGILGTLLLTGGAWWMKQKTAREAATHSPQPTSTPYDPAASRAAADLAVKLGAWIEYEQDGKRKGGRSLPAGDFKLTGVALEKNQTSVRPNDVATWLQAGVLETLQLHQAIQSLDEEVCRLMAAAPSLKIVSLERTNLQDAWLEHLARIPSLESLNVAQCAVTDAGIGPLAHATRLVALDVRDTRVSGKALGLLPMMKTLKRLRIGGSRRRADDDARAVIEAGKSLDSVILKGEIRAESLAGIEGLAYLRDLHLMETSVTSGMFVRMGMSPGLVELSLTECRVADEAWAALPELNRLTKLVLKNVPRTPALEEVLLKFDPPLKVEVVNAANPPAGGGRSD